MEVQSCGYLMSIQEEIILMLIIGMIQIIKIIIQMIQMIQMIQILARRMDLCHSKSYEQNKKVNNEGTIASDNDNHQVPSSILLSCTILKLKLKAVNQKK